MGIYLVIYFQLILAIFVFIALLFYTVPYGRHSLTTNTSKFILSSRTGWLIMEVPAMCTILVVSALTYRAFLLTTNLWWAPLVFLALWEVHYIYRGVIYPFFLSQKNHNMPFFIAMSGLGFNLLNGTINALWLMQIKEYSIAEFYSFHFIIGVVIFILGFAIHFYCDHIMRLYKKNNSSYIVPQQFPHTLVAAPNYLGEIIQWIGWAIATWSLAGVAFAVFTLANLMPRAIAHLKWYRKTFPEYPRKRKAIIPFVI